jgi:hypothetical protein
VLGDGERTIPARGREIENSWSSLRTFYFSAYIDDVTRVTAFDGRDFVMTNV